jgi:hypothetical protein
MNDFIRNDNDDNFAKTTSIKFQKTLPFDDKFFYVDIVEWAQDWVIGIISGSSGLAWIVINNANLKSFSQKSAPKTCHRVTRFWVLQYPDEQNPI